MAMEQPASVHSTFWSKVRDEAGQRLAEACRESSPPRTRAEVSEALVYALHYTPPECLADVILDASEWRHADDELREDHK
jgi:hypothetical protein